jgi:hypothetical protein
MENVFYYLSDCLLGPEDGLLGGGPEAGLGGGGRAGPPLVGEGSVTCELRNKSLLPALPELPCGKD